MDSSGYKDVENQEPAQHKDAKNTHKKDTEECEDYEDYKKMASYHEMAQVHRLTRKIYFQCLVLMVLIGVLLFVFVAHAPYKNVAPIAHDLMSIVGISLFLLLSFFAFMCGSENAQTKLFLIILISIFLGLATGSYVAMNVSIKSKYPIIPYYRNADPIQSPFNN